MHACKKCSVPSAKKTHFDEINRAFSRFIQNLNINSREVLLSATMSMLKYVFN